VNIPFRRGNDGLTDRQRAKSAKRYREGAGKAPTKAEMQELRELASAIRKGQDKS